MSRKCNLKYYFTSSTKDLSVDQGRHKLITKYLDTLGCEAQNYVHFPADNILKKRYQKQLASGGTSVYTLQTSLINQSDILIADITKESITVGYQIDYVIRKKIPVLVLINKNNKHNIPVMLTNNHYGLLTIKEYESNEDIKQIISSFVKSVITDKIKFNFFISIPVHNYITKRAKKDGTTKSALVREIILKEAENHPIE